MSSFTTHSRAFSSSSSSSPLSEPTGKINEKPRGSGAPPTSLPSLAHVLHTLNSIDRYPNFLHRHDDSFAREVEDELDEYVQKLRETRLRREARAVTLNCVKEKYRAAFDCGPIKEKLAALDPRRETLTYEVLSQCLSTTGKGLLAAQMKRHSKVGGDTVDVMNVTHSFADLEGALNMPLGDPSLNVVEVEVRVRVVRRERRGSSEDAAWTFLTTLTNTRRRCSTSTSARRRSRGARSSH